LAALAPITFLGATKIEDLFYHLSTTVEKTFFANDNQKRHNAACFDI
jgi:hypothetical protein